MKSELLPNLEALVQEASESDVFLGLLTDEACAVHWPGTPVDLVSAPWLAQLSTEVIDQAKVAAKRLGQTIDLRDTGPDRSRPDRIELIGIHRSGSDLFSTVSIESEEDSILVHVYRSSPDLFLTELIGPMGFHEFSFRSLRSTAAWLDHLRRKYMTGECVTSRPPDPGTDELALIKSVVASASGSFKMITRVRGKRSVEEVSVYFCQDGIWLLYGRNDGSQTGMQLSLINEDGIAPLIAQVILQGAK